MKKQLPLLLANSKVISKKPQPLSQQSKSLDFYFMLQKKIINNERKTMIFKSLCYLCNEYASKYRLLLCTVLTNFHPLK